MTAIQFYNSLTRRKEPFSPERDRDPSKPVRMYVCGPTVYQAPHLGNARSVVVYDVLFRLLREIYGAEHVVYARNITDVDDKINAGAKERGVPIRVLTDEVTAEFHADMAALGCLPPTIEPRATEHVPQIIAMIEQLIANGHAYPAEGHVLFSVSGIEDQESETGAEFRSPIPDAFDWHYGMLSRRSTDEMIAGARVEVAPYKRNPGDFVLWKPSPESDDASSRFESPWGVGRPGWHIECSAMATAHLGADFDLHGGGADLMFPHHENELAQSCCANPGSHFAKTWVHNGFLTVDGEKMSKSVGNFVTVRDLLERFKTSEAQDKAGEIIRFALLSTHYRKPLDWTEKLFEDAKKQLDYFYGALEGAVADHERGWIENRRDEIIPLLSDDLNLSPLFLAMNDYARRCHTDSKNKKEHQRMLMGLGQMIGIFRFSARVWLGKASDYENIIREEYSKATGEEDPIQKRIDARIAAKQQKNWAEADRIRDELKAEGILLMDRPDGTTEWRRA